MMSQPGQEEEQKITGLRRVTHPPWDRLLLTARSNDYTVQIGSGRRENYELGRLTEIAGGKICYSTGEQTNKKYTGDLK